MKWLTCLPNIFNKEVTWLKINKWGLIYVGVRVIYICTTRFKNLRYNYVWKLLALFPANDFPVFFIIKFFILDVKLFLHSRLLAIY